MSDKELLKKILDTLSGVSLEIGVPAHRQSTDIYNFNAIGKAFVIKRILAEMAGANLNEHLLPGEYPAESPGEFEEMHRFYTELKTPWLSKEDKLYLQTKVLPLFNELSGVSDSDDACLRCAARMVAEVCGYPHLSHYRLLMEKEVKPLYNKKYEQIFIKGAN